MPYEKEVQYVQPCCCVAFSDILHMELIQSPVLCVIQSYIIWSKPCQHKLVGQQTDCFDREATCTIVKSIAQALGWTSQVHTWQHVLHGIDDWPWAISECTCVRPLYKCDVLHCRACSLTSQHCWAKQHKVYSEGCLCRWSEIFNIDQVLSITLQSSTVCSSSPNEPSAKS